MGTILHKKRAETRANAGLRLDQAAKVRPSAATVAQTVTKKVLPYDLEKDLATITLAGTVWLFLIVPKILPRPPDIEVPPSTAAAMAFNSKVSPVAGWAACNWLAMMMPTSAAQKPENM